MIEARDQVTVTLEVNGASVSGPAEPRLLLSDFLRQRLRLTGTHVGCEHGVCGACTVLIDGEPARSCLTFAVQADGTHVTTVEGLAGPEGELHPVQQAFHDQHAMQCGFCTSGFLVSVVAALDANPDADDDELLDALSGNLCRCTGYANILAAARQARERMR
jgi:aerobic carbon-monoxide dehydrogenase small subunit